MAYPKSHNKWETKTRSYFSVYGSCPSLWIDTNIWSEVSILQKVILDIALINVPVFQRILEAIPPCLCRDILNNVCISEIPSYF